MLVLSGLFLCVCIFCFVVVIKKKAKDEDFCRSFVSVLTQSDLVSLVVCFATVTGLLTLKIRKKLDVKQ
jgi:hypothetical protein